LVFRLFSCDPIPDDFVESGNKDKSGYSDSANDGYDDWLDIVPALSSEQIKLIVLRGRICDSAQEKDAARVVVANQENKRVVGPENRWFDIC